MTGRITIYRVTNPGDVVATLAAGERLEVDVDVDPLSPTVKCHDYYVDGSRDVAQNSVVDQDLAEHQDTGLGDEVYSFLISISQRSNGSSGGINAEAQKIENWYQQGSENASFPAGRFGVRINDFAIKNLVPSST